MWICKECKRSFDEPKEVREWHEAYGGRCYETFIYCPKCESPDIDNVTDDFEFDDEEGGDNV